MAASHRGDKQAGLVVLLKQLLQGCIGHTLMAALIHGLALRLIVDSDPLPNTRAQAALSLGAAAAGMAGVLCAFAQPDALQVDQENDLKQLCAS